MKELIDRIKRDVVEVGDCWEWQGCMQSGGTSTPTMRWNGRVNPVRRHLAEAMQLPLKGRVVTCACRVVSCVNPDHVMAVPRSRLQRLIIKEAMYQGMQTRNARISLSARLRSKLTVAQALEIREAQGSQRLIAQQFGVSQATVSKIKRGETWKDYSNPFSGLLR
jgi:hypothetical protein